jgi:hypothetical protein
MAPKAAVFCHLFTGTETYAIIIIFVLNLAIIVTVAEWFKAYGKQNPTQTSNWARFLTVNRLELNSDIIWVRPHRFEPCR